MASTEQIELSPFCGGGGTRWDIDCPWVAHGWRYATDGRICVRVPAGGEPNTVGHRVPLIAEFDGFAADLCTVPFAPPDGPWERCPVCDGTGYGWRDCDLCEGFGSCHCPKCNADHGCGKCDGTGLLPDSSTTCPECDGRQEVPINQRYGNRLLAGKYLAKIAQLPGVKYCEGGTRDTPLPFIADSGLQGVLMVEDK